jgi:hypothetical protein
VKKWQINLYLTFISTDINYDREDFCVYKTWYLAVRKGYLRVFENRMLRKITGLERKGVYGGERTCKEKSRDICCS